MAIEIGMLAAQWVAAIGAVFAFFAVQRQIKHADEQHWRTLAASYRPSVTVTEATIKQAPGGGHYVEATIANVGAGPALNVEVHAWLRTASSRGLASHAYRSEIDAASSKVDWGRPFFVHRPGAIGAGAGVTQDLAIESSHVGESVDGDYLLYIVFFEDLDEMHFPRKPKEEWECGHVLLRPYMTSGA